MHFYHLPTQFLQLYLLYRYMSFFLELCIWMYIQMNQVALAGENNLYRTRRKSLLRISALLPKRNKASLPKQRITQENVCASQGLLNAKCATSPSALQTSLGKRRIHGLLTEHSTLLKFETPLPFLGDKNILRALLRLERNSYTRFYTLLCYVLI